MQFTLLFASLLLALTSPTAALYTDDYNFHLGCTNYTTVFNQHLVLHAECRVNHTSSDTYGLSDDHAWRNTSLDLNKCIWYDESEPSSLQWIAPFCEMQLVDTPAQLRNNTGRQPAPLFENVCPACQMEPSQPMQGHPEIPGDKMPGERLLNCLCKSYEGVTKNVSINLGMYLGFWTSCPKITH